MRCWVPAACVIVATVTGCSARKVRGRIVVADADTGVMFRHEAAGAQTVAVAGTFNQWSPAQMHDEDGDGVWVAQLKIRPGRHCFQFVVDGEWVAPDGRTEPDGFGGRNGVIRVRRR